LTTLQDVKLTLLKTFLESDGNLVPIESNKDIPFNIQRTFYVYDVEDQNNRGKHAHYDTEQVLICLTGSVSVACSDGTGYEQWILDSPNKALYIPSMIWDEQVYATPETILLVLCSTEYDIEDYIENFELFQEEKAKE